MTAIDTERNGPRVLDQAAAFARAGLTIFPTRNKKPMPGYLWKERATNKLNHVIEDFQQAIELWGEDFVEISWACGLDECLVIDLETKDRRHWEDWQNDLFDQAVVNETIRGVHLAFRWPDGIEPGNGVPKALKDAAGEKFDIRGSGGYSVIYGPGRRGMNPDDAARLVEYPHPEHLMPYGGGAQPVSSAEVAAFTQKHNTASNINYLHGIEEGIAQFDASKNGQPGGRHDYCVWLLCCAAEDAQRGYYPFQAALDLIRPWINSVLVEPERRRIFRATHEWDGMLRWAVGNAKAKAVDVPTVDASEGESADDMGDDNTVPALVREKIDWTEFWNEPTTISEWLVEGFWPLGKRVGIFADAGEGKSEWALWCALQIATGFNPITGERVGPGRDAMYLDYELDWDDLRDRLEKFTITEQRDISKLHYMQMPSVGGVDTPEGRKAVLEAAKYLGVEAVVIDTYSMATEGPENEADTAHAVLRDLGNPLKSAGIGLLIVHHAGKVKAAGGRGSSAIVSQVDIMWRLDRQAGTNETILSCTGEGRKRRQSWVPSKLRLRRNETDDGTIEYEWQREIADLVMTPAVTNKVYELESAGIAWDLTHRETVDALKALGLTAGKTTTLAAAIRYRKEFYAKNPQGQIGRPRETPLVSEGKQDSVDNLVMDDPVSPE